MTWALVTALIQAGGRAELFALSSIAVLSQYLVTAAALLALALRRQRGLTARHALLAVPAGLVALAIVAGASPRRGGRRGGRPASSASSSGPPSTAARSAA